MTIKISSGTSGSMIAAALTYFSAFLSGDMDPLLTHIVLLGGSIVAEFAVAAGIILESPKEKACREKLGLVLVLGGVMVSAIFMILLFIFDEGISGAHQSEIGRLRVRAAQLSKDVEVARAEQAEAHARTAEATKKAAEADERTETLRRQQGRRRLDSAAMITILRHSTGTVEIAYLGADWDSTLLAHTLEYILSSAGWAVSATPLSVDELSKGRLTTGWWSLDSRTIPSNGTLSWVRIGEGTAPEEVSDRSPFTILAGAMLRGLGSPAIVTNFSQDPSLPEGHFRLFLFPR